MKFLIVLITLCIIIFALEGCTAENLTELFSEHLEEPKSTIIEENGILRLTENTTLDSTYSIDGQTLDLNGNTLTLYNTLYMNSGSVIKNGTIVMDDTSCAAISANGNNVTIENITLKVTGTNFAIGVRACRTVNIINSKISVSTTNQDKATSAYGILSELLGGAIIKNSDITASVKYGTAIAVDIQAEAEIYNSQIKAYANYDSDNQDYLSYSIGCRNLGNLHIENSYVYGVHSGIDTSGDTYINGGTYEGFGHGGIYCSGNGSTYYIYNCVIQAANMPDGFEPMRTARTENGMYVGGGANRNNMTIYMDGCNISGIKYDVVLRGSSSEKNNNLYVSNCIFGQNKIRIDNNTHALFVGKGCNLTDESYTLIEAVFITNEEYKGNYK